MYTPKTGFHELHIHVLYMHTQVQFCANGLACPCSQSIMHCPHTYSSLVLVKAVLLDRTPGGGIKLGINVRPVKGY